MDVLRDIRTNYKDFLAHLFIDFILLWMRFVNKIYRIKNGSDITTTTTTTTTAKNEGGINSESQDMSRKINEDRKGKVSKWTEDANGRKSRPQETTELMEEEDSHLGRSQEEQEHEQEEQQNEEEQEEQKEQEQEEEQEEQNEEQEQEEQEEQEEEMHWSSNGRHPSNYSESLEEMDSSILESTRDLQRQISALSDYYSDDEDIANKWAIAKRDKAIAESQAIATDLDNGSSDFRMARSTYDSFCEGLERLRDDFGEIQETWKKRNEESSMRRDVRGGSESVEVHRRRRSDAWNRSAAEEEAMDTWRGSHSSVLNGNLERSTSQQNASFRERKRNLEQHNRQMPEPHDLLMQQRNTLNRLMFQEHSETKEQLTLLEKKRIELCTKVNDEEWKSLSDSCDVLYSQQPQLRDHCRRLTRNMVARKKDVQDGVDIYSATLEGLGNCLSDESQRLKVWNERKVKLNQIEQTATNLKRQFDERKTIITEMECKSYVAKLTDSLQLHTTSSAPFMEEWNAVSHRATEILEQKYLELVEHEDRCFEWKDFSEEDEFREEYERYLEAFQEYVPRICQIHERRSAGATGIFGPKPESAEFNRFYQNYKRKMKAIGEDYSGLESSRMSCHQNIEKYDRLHGVLLNLIDKQKQVDEVFRREDSRIRTTQEKLRDYRDLVHSHLISNQGKRLTDEKRQIVDFLKKIEKQLNVHEQTIEMFENSLTATRNTVEEIEMAQILRRHFERLKTFAADWEKEKRFDKLYDLISQVENFQASENPQRLKFEDHEERVNFLEKRLPKIAKLHQENCATYLQTWLAYSLEYNESQMEPLSFDEMAKQCETWSSVCQKIPRVLGDLKRELTDRLKQLRRVDESLSLLSAQGCELHASESANSFTESFDAHFSRVDTAYRNFRQALADFQPLFGRYAELKMGHRQIMETLAKESYSSDKLTEKLENCRGVLRGHRDHLERRRIRIKMKELLVLLKEALFVKANESEAQVKNLEVECESLIHDFVDLSGRRFSEITRLQIPNLSEFLNSLENCDRYLKDCEEKIGKCEKTLIKEEITVHEYCNKVRHLTAFLTEASESTKVLEANLEAGKKLLNGGQSFIESYTKQEKCFDTHLRDSKRIFAEFKTAFNSAENEANDLDKLFTWYSSQFASDASGESFREESFAELTEMYMALVDYRNRLRETEHCIKTNEIEVGKRLEEGKSDREGIRNKLSVLPKDISDQIELLKKCKLLLLAIQEGKVERESRATAYKKRLQDENYDEHCKMYQRNPIEIENDEDFICFLCSKTTKPHDGIILRECSHRFCKRCLERRIRDSKAAEVACPGSEDQTPCFGIILDKEIQTFGEDVSRLCADRSLSEYKDQNRYALTCGSCSKLIVDDGQPRCQKPFFTCPYCEKKNCRKCRVVHEGRETCNDYEMTLPYRKIVESLKCILCSERDIRMAFIPCGHLVCCEECSKKLKECPCCKKPIQETLKIYSNLPINIP